jgi:hypothetical protein
LKQYRAGRSLYYPFTISKNCAKPVVYGVSLFHFVVSPFFALVPELVIHSGTSGRLLGIFTGRRKKQPAGALSRDAGLRGLTGQVRAASAGIRGRRGFENDYGSMCFPAIIKVFGGLYET